MIMKTITEKNIISLANEDLKKVESYLPWMVITSAQQEGDKVIFRGEIMTDDYGLPSKHTHAAQSAYMELSTSYSETYRLES